MWLLKLLERFTDIGSKSDLDRNTFEAQFSPDFLSHFMAPVSLISSGKGFSAMIISPVINYHRHLTDPIVFIVIALITNWVILFAC
jgi:hypothetical protein